MASFGCLKILCFTLFIFINFFLPFSHPLSFSINHFEQGAKNMLYDGDAMPSSLGTIELQLVESSRVGRATYAEPLHLWDSTRGSLAADFICRFSFPVDTLNHPEGYFGDGLVFFLAPVDYPIPPDSAGSNLGLFNSTTRFAVSQNHIVGIEFDTFSNSEYDPPGSHIGININTIRSVVNASWDASLHSGEVTHVQIIHNATTNNLSVFWIYGDDLNPDFVGASSLSYQIDLRKILPEWVTIGFSAATGIVDERNVLYSWVFSSDETSHKNESKTYLIGVVAASFFILMMGLTIFWLARRQRTTSLASNGSNGFNAALPLSTIEDLERLALPKKIAYKELVAATNGFAQGGMLGRGGSAEVYKGTLQDPGLTVAVKRIFSSSDMEYVKTFNNEVKIISCLNHRNLVRFIGWCHEKGECLLVYAYMHNKSLDKHLFGPRRPLKWDLRHKIALGLASAIHYLHEGVEQYVVHRDIKSANVLLDEEFNTKLGDFGISKLVDPQFRTQTTRLVGTRGYVSPEYANQGRASKESDMFSFGVVALELACGRRSYQDEGFHMPSLVTQVWRMYLEGNHLAAADEKLNMKFDRNEMECLLVVGLWCTNPNFSQRPKAGQVMMVLQLKAPLPELPRDMHDQPPPQPRDQAASSLSA